MEPLFRNINIKSEDKCREIYRNVFTSYHVFYGILILFAVAYNIYWIWWYYSINIILLIYAVLTIIVYFTRPYSYAKKRVKNYISLYNNAETDEVLFYEDCFIDKDIYSKSETRIEYEKISSVKTTKNFYIFSIKGNKIKFTIGKDIENLTENTDFVQFINSRLINSKNKIK